MESREGPPLRALAAAATVSIQAHGPNEDRFGIFPELGLFVVADGMGGYGEGGDAAACAVDATRAFFGRTRRAPGKPAPSAPDPSKSLERTRLLLAMQQANHEVFDFARSGRRRHGTGTTIATLTLSGEGIHCAHAGNCRVSRMRAGRIKALTEDHLLIHEFKRYKPDISPEELAALPRNVITRALGLSERIKADLGSDTPEPGDIYLLTTDGLHEALRDDAIASILQEHKEAAAAARALVVGALERGSMDDITCVLVRLLAQ